MSTAFEPLSWPAEQLLAVTLPQARRLFSGDDATMRELFRRLAAKWHPDRNADVQATRAFAHLQALFDAARAAARAGPASVEFTCRDGRRFQLRYLRRRPFELGEMFLAQRFVAYRVEEAHRDLFDRAVRTLRALPCADAGMLAEVGRYLPRIEACLDTSDGPVLVLAKDPDQILLADLVAHLGGRLEPRHAAWVLSSLFNLACFLDYADLAHNAIGTETFFVSPQAHTGALLGGWWYAAPFGSPLVALPEHSAASIPSRLLDRRIAVPAIDLELIHALGRELIGDARGVGFLARPDIPPALFNAVRLPPAGDAVSAYRNWRSTLLASFGKRTFTELAVSPTDVYQEH